MKLKAKPTVIVLVAIVILVEVFLIRCYPTIPWQVTALPAGATGLFGAILVFIQDRRDKPYAVMLGGLVLFVSGAVIPVWIPDVPDSVKWTTDLAERALGIFANVGCNLIAAGVLIGAMSSKVAKHEGQNPIPPAP